MRRFHIQTEPKPTGGDVHWVTHTRTSDDHIIPSDVTICELETRLVNGTIDPDDATCPDCRDAILHWQPPKAARPDDLCICSAPRSAHGGERDLGRIFTHNFTLANVSHRETPR